MEERTACRNIRPLFVPFLLILAVLWSGCSGGGKGGISGPVNPQKPLTWEAPTQFADGGALDPSKDLSSYEIYINETGTFLPGDAPGAVSPAVDAASGVPVTAYDLSTIVPPLQAGNTYFLAMRSVERNGGKSDLTPPVRFVY